MCLHELRYDMLGKQPMFSGASQSCE
jgi:hypothetical protein